MEAFYFDNRRTFPLFPCPLYVVVPLSCAELAPPLNAFSDPYLRLPLSAKIKHAMWLVGEEGAVEKV